MLLEKEQFKPYQDRAVDFLVNHKVKPPLPHKALWLDMGLGKTIITLTALVELKKRGELVKPALLVGTIRIIYSVWRQEARKWRHTRGLRFSLVHGTLSERLAALRKPADIYLINYENLQWLESLTELDRPDFGVFIADESSRLKAHNTKRFKALRKMLHMFDRRWLLTGTPAPNSLLNLWSQIFILDEGQRLGRSYAIYRQRYFEAQDYQGFTYGPRPGADRRIRQLVAPLVMRLDARDYIKMPKVTTNFINLELPQELRAMYAEMERRMFLELDNIEVEVFNAATLTAKCWQFANGALYGNSKARAGEREWQAVHSLKLDTLEEVLEEAEGNPVLVPYWFRSDVTRLKERFDERFKNGVPTIGSGVKPAQADELVKQWNRGKLPLLLVHYVTAAHGLNLQAGGHIMYCFSQTWSLELHDQIIARLARQGQEHPVMVHKPVMRGTVDEAIQDSIRLKARGQSNLLNALRRYRAQRELLG